MGRCEPEMKQTKRWHLFGPHSRPTFPRRHGEVNLLVQRGFPADPH